MRGGESFFKEEKMLYILNTLIVPINFDENNETTVKMKRINVDEAKFLLAGGFKSAVGHQSTAEVISKIFGVQIPAERKTVFFKKGDKGIHFFLKQRLPEGQILTQEELEKLDYWLVLSEVL
jgi:hypothetical protein